MSAQRVLTRVINCAPTLMVPTHVPVVMDTLYRVMVKHASVRLYVLSKQSKPSYNDLLLIDSGHFLHDIL